MVEEEDKPLCPMAGCRVDARRPKCLFELGSTCPRHDALYEWNKVQKQKEKQ
jgi:hypothetical protein